MTWNYRLMAHKDKQERIYFQVHIAYYDEQEEIPHSYSATPVPLCADTLKEIQWVIDKIKIGLEKPILKTWDFPNEL